MLEQQTEARQFLDSDGDDIFKNGIMVDAFRGHSVGDVLNADYVCSIDYENGHLRAPFTSKGLKLENVSDTGITISPDGIAMMDYNEWPNYIWQPLASGTVQPNPFNIPCFMGHIKFNDPFDGWYDQTNKPIVKINTQGENDRWKTNNENSGYGFGTQWNDWESLWSGRTITTSDIYGNRGRDYLDAFSTVNLPSNIENRTRIASSNAIRSTETLKNNEGRSGIRIRRLPDRLEKLVNDRLVDVSVVPFMRAKTVTLSAYGMKPNTTVYPFFDGGSVSSRCGPAGGVSGGGITADASGNVSNMFFSIESKKYRTGEKLFRLTDNPSNTVEDTTTAADGIYYAQGIVQQRDGELTSTRPVVSRRQVVNDEAIVRDAFDREQYMNTSANNLWLDPLAQTFTIDRNTYPSGSFLHSVRLFFQQRDENVPITLEIRPTIGGYPHLSQVMPLSTVSLIPAADEIKTDYPLDDTYTEFKFTTPLYLSPGEYSMCLRTSSSNYKLYSAAVGEGDLQSGVLINEQPYSGTLFTPENTTIATPNANESLKFKIVGCKFNTDASPLVTFRIASDETDAPTSADKLTIDTFKVSSGEHVPTNSSLNYTFTMPAITTTSTISNENIYLESPQILDGIDSTNFTLTGNLTTSNTWVSPVIDTKRMDLIAVSNTINNNTDSSSNGELNYNANSTNENDYGSGTDNPTSMPGAAARYITRRVTLADGFESKNFKVLLSVNKPAEATVQVFIKPLPEEDDTPFEEVGYTLMTADSTVPDSANNYDFSDITYSLSSSFDKSIKTFAIKVCLYSSSSTKVPSVKDFRTIALAG